MSGLISRDAAIDALGERPIVWTDDDQYTLGERNQYDIDRLAIETLPSAQPERWTPVAEGLPGYGEGVIANFRNEQIGRDRIGVSYCYVQKEGFFSDVPFEYKVVAWMPLPEPWKGEEDEERLDAAEQG